MEDIVPETESSDPLFAHKAEQVAAKMKTFSLVELMEMMNINSDLSELNYSRYQQWEHPETPQRQAVLAFRGEVYRGLNALSLSAQDLVACHARLRILSGMYGILRPLDLIRPYRLEMSIRVPVGNSANLYAYWSEQVTAQIIRDMEALQTQTLLNLASAEYFKVINSGKLPANYQIISPEFKEQRPNGLKTIVVHTKKARGLMSRFVIENDLQKVEDLFAFEAEGYRYLPSASTPSKPLFVR